MSLSSHFGIGDTLIVTEAKLKEGSGEMRVLLCFFKKNKLKAAAEALKLHQSHVLGVGKEN